MTFQASVYVFLLGVATGLAVLAMTAYRRVSPSWLKWLLIATGFLTLSRYIVMALFAAAEHPQQIWAWRYGYYATSIGFTLPSVMAVDQLLRHPKMSPQRLLRWISPLLLADALIIGFATVTLEPDRLLGLVPHLANGWRWAFTIVQGLFVLGFIGAMLLLLRQPYLTRPARTAFWGLLLAYAALGADGVVLALGGWYVRPFLYSDMATLLAIWYAYDTSANLSQLPGS